MWVLKFTNLHEAWKLSSLFIIIIITIIIIIIIVIIVIIIALYSKGKFCLKTSRGGSEGE